MESGLLFQSILERTTLGNYRLVNGLIRKYNKRTEQVKNPNWQLA